MDKGVNLWVVRLVRTKSSWFSKIEWIGMIRNECEGFKMIFRKIFLWSHKPKVVLVISHESHPCPGSTVCLSRVIWGHLDTVTYYSNAVISRHWRGFRLKELPNGWIRCEKPKGTHHSWYQSFNEYHYIYRNKKLVTGC